MEKYFLEIPHFLMLVGLIEIFAGFLVWFYPRFGSYVIIAWLGLIIINLAMIGGLLDIIARDIVIAIGAFALAMLTQAIQIK